MHGETAGGLHSSREVSQMRLTDRQIEDFIQQHDLHWETAPEQWDHGIPLANGHIGAMIWGDGSPLRITLDKYDCWELREQEEDPEVFNYENLRRLVAEGAEEEANWDLNCRWRLPEKPYPTRLPMPRIEVQLPAADEFDAVLSLYNAAAQGTVGEAASGIEWAAWIADGANLLMLSFHGRELTGTSDLDIRVGLDHLDEEAKQRLADWGYEQPERGCSENVHYLRQRFPAGGEYVVAWMIEEVRGELHVPVAILSHHDADEPLAEAIALVREAPGRRAELWEEHTAWWRTWWCRSWLSVPDTMLEALWYAEMYKLGCSSRPGGLPTTLQGLWTADGIMPPWSGDYHLDMNVQETYWPVYASNHLEAGEPLYETFFDCIPRWREECRQFFGFDGIWTRCAIAWDGSHVHGYHGVEYWPGNAAWLAHHYWLHWLYSRDEEFLRQRALPMMRGAMETYMNLLEPDDDGTLHLPLGYSPEWGEDSVKRYGPDPSCDIALIRWLGESLLETTATLGMADDPDRERWQDTLERLVDYPTDETGLMVHAEDRLWQSHRHHSHLMAIHPLGTLTVEGGEKECALIMRSIQHWIEIGPGRWTGWSFPWASLIASRVGLGNMAWEKLRQYFAFIRPNTLHINGDPRVFGNVIARYSPMTLEAGFCAATAIMEMLLQSWGGIIRLFPTIPDCWGEAQFEDLRAEGGFLVSAALRKSEVAYVRIVSEAGEECVMRNPWPGESVTVSVAAGPALTVEGDELRWETEASVEYLLLPEGAARSRESLRPAPPRREVQERLLFGVKRISRF